MQRLLRDEPTLFQHGDIIAFLITTCASEKNGGESVEHGDHGVNCRSNEITPTIINNMHWLNCIFRGCIISTTEITGL